MATSDSLWLLLEAVWVDDMLEIIKLRKFINVVFSTKIQKILWSKHFQSEEGIFVDEYAKIKKMTKIRTIVLMLALMVIPSAAIAAENYMSLLDQIDKALTSRDWALSERLIKTALEMKPANPSNYLLMSNLGTVYRNQGKLDESLENYNMALSVAPKSTTILHNRAALYLEMDSVQSALADYNKLLDINPSDCIALNGAGMIALRLAIWGRRNVVLTNA